MLQICISATRNSCATRALGRSAHSLLHSQNAAKAATNSCSTELHVGVLGLGAIGTIFFTRLGQLAVNSRTKEELPTLKVDAYIKPTHFDNWVKKTEKKLHLSLEGLEKEGKAALEFQVNSDGKVATVCNAPNVRVRTLEIVADGDGCDDKLDVLLVAVKAYDSVGVIRELRERNRHLLKDDALCVLLQNGLGELSQEEGGYSLSGVDDQWQFANGVTFVGGRVLEFGSVVMSGLDAGMTYLAPFAGSGVHSVKDGASEDGMMLKRGGDTKMETLARVFRAAGLHCEVLEGSKMQAMLWRKLIVNAAINPLASLLDAPNRCVASSEGSRNCVEMVVQEALAVAECEQIPLVCTQNVQRDTDNIVFACDLTIVAVLPVGTSGRYPRGGSQHWYKCVLHVGGSASWLKDGNRCNYRAYCCRRKAARNSHTNE